MKYQVLKRLKTKSKLVKLCNTLEEAKDLLTSLNAHFVELSYIGQFPVYKDEKSYYNIQGLHIQLGIVLGLSKEDLQTYA